MIKNALILILLASNIAFAVLCNNWSTAYENLQSDYKEATNPSSRRADIYVLANGDVWTLFDGRWVYEFKGACAGLIKDKKYL